MTDLVQIPSTTTDLVRFAEEASQVHGIAKALSGTSFVPKAMQGRPDEITGAILYGRELGMDPMTALQTVHVIEGRPTLTANAMRGLAVGAGVKFRLLSASDTRVQMEAKAPGDDQWTAVDWTIDRAKKQGLTGKKNWQNMPQSMLIARATSELCRLVASNVLIGTPYSAEEMQDLGPQAWDETKPVSPAAPAKTANSRKYKRADTPVTAFVEPEPEPWKPPAQIQSNDRVPKEIGYSTDDVPSAEPFVQENPLQAGTRKAIMAGFNERNITSRNERLERVSRIVGREIHSVNMLNEDEGRQVVAYFGGNPGNDWSDVDVAQVPQS